MIVKFQMNIINNHKEFDMLIEMTHKVKLHF